MNQETKQRVKEPEASKFTGMSVAWLRLKRMYGQKGGPPFIRVGRSILYDVHDLEAWLQKHKDQIS